MLLDVIRNYLANTAPINVEVGPRIRLSGTNGPNAIPANGTGTVQLNLPLPVLSGPGSAFWLEYLAGSLQASVKGLTISDVLLAFANSTGIVFLPAGQAVLTTLSPQNLSGITFIPLTPLIMFEDLLAEATANGTAFTQPLRLALAVTVNNSTAGAINFSVSENDFIRIVQGLQEG